MNNPMPHLLIQKRHFSKQNWHCDGFFGDRSFKKHFIQRECGTSIIVERVKPYHVFNETLHQISEATRLMFRRIEKNGFSRTKHRSWLAFYLFSECTTYLILTPGIFPRVTPDKQYLWVLHDIHARTGTCVSSVWTVLQHPGYGHNSFVRTRNFCVFCTIFIPGPGICEGTPY